MTESGAATSWGDLQRIMEWIPHRWPYVLVDRIVTLDRDARRVTGIKNVTATEPHFLGHFPGAALMPGVLIIEGMAQTGLVLLYQMIPRPETKLVVFAGVDRARFRRQVVPGDQLHFEVEISLSRKLAKLAGTATVDSDNVMEAELLAYVIDRPGMGASA
jgi:beta-hydroxyacyl-ACP dehydratase FabZ